MIFKILVALLVAFCQTSGASVSDAQKQEILDSHNEWRQKAGATAMLRLVSIWCYESDFNGDPFEEPLKSGQL